MIVPPPLAKEQRKRLEPTPGIRELGATDQRQALRRLDFLEAEVEWQGGVQPTGLRRGHLADLEVVVAILKSDPRIRASAYDADVQVMAEAVQGIIDDPDLHNPGSYTHLQRASDK